MDVLHESFDIVQEIWDLWESSKPRLEVLEILEDWLKTLYDKWNTIPNTGYGSVTTDEVDDYVFFLAMRVDSVESGIEYFIPETIGKPSRKKAYLESLWEDAFDRE